MQYDSEAQLEWGGGLKQRVAAAERVAAMAAEAAKPFARSADDAELDTMHRRRTRWGDPMVRGRAVSQSVSTETGIWVAVGESSGEGQPYCTACGVWACQGWTSLCC